MPSRREHKKSRHGCGQCKQRHVKCDVRYYVCSNCERRGEWCDFQLQRPDLPSSSVSPPLQHVIQMPSLPQAKPGMLLSVQVDSPMARAWDPIVMQQVEKHSFLQHGYSALVALYDRKASQEQSLGNYLSAYQDHLAAIHDFRCISATTFSRSDWASSVIFSMMVATFEMGVAGIQPGEDFMLSTIIALRNGAQLAKTIASHFLKAREQEDYMLNGPTIQSPECHLLLQALDSELAKFGNLGQLDIVCQHALMTLKAWIFRIGYPRTWSHLLFWPASLNAEFLDLLRGKDYVAMLIARYWAHVVSRMSGVWFLRSWAVVVRVN